MKTNPMALPCKIAGAYLDDYPLANKARETELRGWLRSRHLPGLADATSGSDVSDPDFAKLRQVSALFKKNKSLSNGRTCTENAVSTFLRAEKQCRITNKRLDYYYENPDRLPDDLLNQVTRMQKSIANTLGDFGDFLAELPSLLRLTSGATHDRSRPRSYPHLKVTGRIKAPQRLLPLYGVLADSLGQPRDELQLVPDDVNRVQMVPKNWETHRTIAAEPTHAMPFQLAFDAWGKRCLRKVGIDLSSQELNQELSRWASVLGVLATVDMKTASDTTAYNAVAWLFPWEWFDFLDRCRSKGYSSDVMDDGMYAKFSSMGNGSTFVIETLIFAAACKAVGSECYSVYGDDIIIESRLVPELDRLLRFVGYRMNEAKSFTDGPFRESCGTDWLAGKLVTPFYMRRSPASRADWSHLINGLITLGYEGGSLYRLAQDLLLEEEPALVPWNEATMAGVWIPPSVAYDLKLIRNSWQTPTYQGYAVTLPPDDPKRVSLRRYLLWFIQKRHLADVFRENQDGVVLVEDNLSSHETTGSSVSGSFVRKSKVVYRPPLDRVPGFIYGFWIDFQDHPMYHRYVKSVLRRKSWKKVNVTNKRRSRNRPQKADR